MITDLDHPRQGHRASQHRSVLRPSSTFHPATVAGPPAVYRVHRDDDQQRQIDMALFDRGRQQAHRGTRHDSPTRRSPERRSPTRRSPERRSPTRRSPERRSPSRSPTRRHLAASSPNAPGASGYQYQHPDYSRVERHTMAHPEARASIAAAHAYDNSEFRIEDTVDTRERVQGPEYDNAGRPTVVAVHRTESGAFTRL